ncbi:hypothetical protein NIES2100_05490 [Calothrix sp. NIES-2100]|uniref:structural cement protein Gp24 n=1 Tax=Calothrix sp. NIES-2100 TaxID=1954172 RepID=UPI000B5F9F11|nr:hypothetical protein NIES2100_05490 [Calothrix sp. NIES-2100]
MPIGQTSVKYTQDFALFEGQVLSNPGVNVVRERYNLSGAVIPFGRAVVVGGTKNAVILPNTTGLTPVGLTIINQYHSSPDLGDNTSIIGYPDKSLVSIVTRGGVDVVVYSATATDIDDPVFFRHANGTGLAGFGTFRNSTATDYTAWTAARFVKKTSGAGLSVINIGGF